MKLIILLICRILYLKYGYEGLNLVLRVLPMTLIPIVLKKYGATIEENVRIKSPFTVNDANNQLKPFENLYIGSNTFIGRNCLFDLRDKVIIGKNVTISHQVSILTHVDAGESPLKDKILKTSHAPVNIQQGAYIGFGATILQGVVIGELAVIGANSLVNKNIPNNFIAYGVPAKPINQHTT